MVFTAKKQQQTKEVNAPKATGAKPATAPATDMWNVDDIRSGIKNDRDNAAKHRNGPACSIM